MTRPRLLDLFCGAGGAAMGYHRAGFDVMGVDIEPQPRYPFHFVRADALAVFDDDFWILGGIRDFDAIHASPPCQAYSSLGARWPNREHPDLVAPVRELLRATGLPYIIENVPGSPTHHHIVLCGSMFGLNANGRQLRRHRNFEMSFSMMSPPCQHEGAAIGVYGGGPASRGSYQGLIAEKREAMGIGWMSSHEINQAIPPAYTELIGYQLIQQIQAQNVA